MSGHCPFMTLNCHLAVPFISLSCPFHISHDPGFHAFQLPLQVPAIFSVCPLHLPRMSRSFVCASFPSHSPCTPLVFISVPCMSLSVPLCFPFISRCFLCSPIFPAKNTVFPAFSQLGGPKTQSFSRFSAEGGRTPKPAKSRQGELSLGHL